MYVLGTGDYLPQRAGDSPFTSNAYGTGSDCAGFAICWCYMLPRHRPGYNHASGALATVEDDINCNSALEDARFGNRELFRLVDGVPQPGDLLVYPSFDLTDKDGNVHKFIGHVSIVVGNTRVKQWSTSKPPYYLLDVAQCKGPNGRAPAVLLTDGSIWSQHDATWPKPQHRSYVIRPSNAPLSASFRQIDVLP